MKNKEYYAKKSLEYYHRDPEKAAIKAKLYRENNKDHIRIKQREDKRLRKKEAIQYLGGCCSLCKGVFHDAAFEFHHRIPEEKERDPSKMLSLSWKKIAAELDKCDLVCANCHRVIHYGEIYQ